jgi:hypothetical protein
MQRMITCPEWGSAWTEARIVNGEAAACAAEIERAWKLAPRTIQRLVNAHPELLVPGTRGGRHDISLARLTAYKGGAVLALPLTV